MADDFHADVRVMTYRRPPDHCHAMPVPNFRLPPCFKVQGQEEVLLQVRQEVHGRQEGHRGRAGAAEEALLRDPRHGAHADQEAADRPEEGAPDGDPGACVGGRG